MPLPLVQAILSVAGKGAGFAAEASGMAAVGRAGMSMGNAVAGNKHVQTATKLGKSQLKETMKQGKAASKMAGVSFGISSMLKQSQIFTGVVGSIFQLVGAFIDIMLIPLVPIVGPILEMAGKALGKFAKFSAKNPEMMMLVMFRAIPILGIIITALQIILWIKDWLTGPSKPIEKMKSGILSFFERAPIMIKKWWTTIKLWGVKTAVMVLEAIDTTWSTIRDWLASITWDFPMVDPFNPFGAVGSINSPVAGILASFQEKELALETELKDLNTQLRGIIGPDGVKIYGEHLFERLDHMATSSYKGSEGIYNGYNTGIHTTDEENRMLLTGYR